MSGEEEDRDHREEEPLSGNLVSRLPDADMQAAPIALLRAARRAREIARQTGTAVVISRDGKLVEERPDEREDD